MKDIAETGMVLEEQKDTLESQNSTLGGKMNDTDPLNETSESLTESNVSELTPANEYNEEIESRETELKLNEDKKNDIEDSKADTDLQVNEKSKNPNAKWYILQAYSGYEGRVKQTIQEKLKIASLEHLVEEIFIPSEDVIHNREGKKRKVNQKYFPGYILIHMELTPDLWHLLMAINRVSGFIGGTQKKPLPLEESELEIIRSQLNERFQQKATEEEFSLGQKVTITEGSFGNFSGTIDEINLERRKLKVLISIFGRPTPVEVEFEKVKHVTE